MIDIYVSSNTAREYMLKPFMTPNLIDFLIIVHLLTVLQRAKGKFNRLSMCRTSLRRGDRLTFGVVGRRRLRRPHATGQRGRAGLAVPQPPVPLQARETDDRQEPVRAVQTARIRSQPNYNR